MEERYAPMRRVLTRLIEEYEVPLGKATAVDLFAREGDWQTVVYAPYVGTLEAWEINPQFHEALRRNLPYAKTRITDTWKEIKTVSRKYDLVVVDNPQGIYGGHCEHFGLLPDIFRVANDGCVIILNVNVEPYNLHEGSEWWRRRRDYYETEHPEKLSVTQVKRHYHKVCLENGVGVLWSFLQQRENGFIYYFVMRIRNKNE